MNDVIAALATPWGVAALALIRLSGHDLERVLHSCMETMGGTPIAAGLNRRVKVLGPDGEALDDGVLNWVASERTYTGEPTAELTVHGNPVIVRAVLDRLQDAGARMARPGEFTRRAVLHGKVDLVQAEATRQVIHSATIDGARMARRGLDGTLSAVFGSLRTDLVVAVAEFEARLDYPADELALEHDESVLARLGAVRERALQLASTYSAARARVEGARVALVGPVNAGKSSLFNRLLGRDRALVHDTPGTTRDIVEATMVQDGIAVTLMDTAGERETTDPVEAAGLEMARSLLADVDLHIVVLRAKDGALSDEERELLDRTQALSRIVVLNGIDRPHEEVPCDVRTSALHNQGITELRSHITSKLAHQELVAGDLMIADVRQRDRLLEVARGCEASIAGLEEAGVAVAAECLMEAIEAIDEVTGADSREEVLDALFARFCIGK